MASLINCKIGFHKEKRRVYLQGRKLSRQGVEPGQHYNVVEQGNNLVLEINPNGKYKVSRRKSNDELLPVIDLRVDEIAKLFEGVEVVRAAVKAGRIVISAHHQHSKTKAREERLARKLEAGEALDMCGLYHGGGVLEKAVHVGLASAGIKTRSAVVVEIESTYLESSLQNNPELFDEDSIVIESPVEQVNLQTAPEVDVLIAGLPCTGASKSGRTKGKLEYAESHEQAGAQFFSFLQFVQALNPAIVWIENVVEYSKTASMVVIRSVLASLGYTMQEAVLNGNEFGALENRNRMCAIAVSNGIAMGDIKGITPVRQKEACLNDVLDPIAMDDARWKSFDYLAEKETRDKAAGKGFNRQLLTGQESSCGTIGRGYSKCRSTEPFLVHPMNEKLSRILTPNEHARVKGVPASVVAGLSDTIAHEVLGQSVIFPAFEAVGKWLGIQLWNWRQLTPILVQFGDADAAYAGNDEFYWSVGLVDSFGKLRRSPVSESTDLSPVEIDTDEGRGLVILTSNHEEIVVIQQYIDSATAGIKDVVLDLPDEVFTEGLPVVSEWARDYQTIRSAGQRSVSWGLAA